MTILKKRKSEISKSAHLFSWLNIVILALGIGILLSLQAHAESVKDRYFYRIENQVFGVNDLSIVHDDLSALFCLLPDGLLSGWLGGDPFLDKLEKNVKELKELKGPLRAEHPLTIFLAHVRQLLKLLIYIDTQEATVTPELSSTLMKQKGCPSIMFGKDKMRESFLRWLRVEVYLRARYAPAGLTNQKEWRDKRVYSIAQLVESLDKQLLHENLW